jgi:hypothetical protein
MGPVGVITTFTGVEEGSKEIEDWPLIVVVRVEGKTQTPFVSVACALPHDVMVHTLAPSALHSHVPLEPSTEVNG